MTTSEYQPINGLPAAANNHRHTSNTNKNNSSKKMLLLVVIFGALLGMVGIGVYCLKFVHHHRHHHNHNHNHNHQLHAYAKKYSFMVAADDADHDDEPRGGPIMVDNDADGVNAAHVDGVGVGAYLSLTQTSSTTVAPNTFVLIRSVYGGLLRDGDSVAQVIAGVPHYGVDAVGVMKSDRYVWHVLSAGSFTANPAYASKVVFRNAYTNRFLVADDTYYKTYTVPTQTQTTMYWDIPTSQFECNTHDYNTLYRKLYGTLKATAYYPWVYSNTVEDSCYSTQVSAVPTVSCNTYFTFEKLN